MKYFFSFFLTIVILKCGYTTKMPSQFVYKRIGISFIENKTLKPMLEVILREELENHFKSIPQIKLVSLKEAELIISGVIENYEKKPAVYDAFQNIKGWQIIISCQVKGEEKITEKIVLNSSITQSLNYSAEEDEGKAIRELVKKIVDEIYRQFFSQW